MAITLRGSGASTTDAATWTSSALTTAPAAGELPYAFVGVTGTTATDWVVTDNLGGTWTKIDHAVKSTSVDMQELWVRNALSDGTTFTITYAHASGTATGWAYAIFSISGMLRTGAAAVRQFGRQDNGASSTTPTVTWSQAALTQNPSGVSLHISSQTPTATITGWTKNPATAPNHATPSAALSTFTRDSGFTGTSVATAATVAATYSLIAAEFDTSPQLPIVVMPPPTPY